jgi:hypothetical protein
MTKGRNTIKVETLFMKKERRLFQSILQTTIITRWLLTDFNFPINRFILG